MFTALKYVSQRRTVPRSVEGTLGLPGDGGRIFLSALASILPGVALSAAKDIAGSRLTPAVICQAPSSQPPTTSSLIIHPTGAVYSSAMSMGTRLGLRSPRVSHMAGRSTQSQNALTWML